MKFEIDHLVYAVPSLEEGMNWATEHLGTEPVYGGEHEGLGTCNALLSLGSSYLEILAPNEKRLLKGTMGARLAALPDAGLVTWAVQGNLKEINKILWHFGVETLGPFRTERRTSEGEILAWDLLFPHAGPRGTPFFIDWLECPHPSTTSPVAGKLNSLIIATPDVTRLRELLDTMRLDVQVAQGAPSITASIKTGQGQAAIYTTHETAGISLR